VANDHRSPTTVYGPFSRWETPGASGAQSLATAVKQVLSGEIWGETANGVARPKVEAHRGPIPEGKVGIEFYALAPPDSQFGPRPYWVRPGPNLSVEYDNDKGRDVAKLRVAFVKITQDLLHEASIAND
jgi:hypothetical protein